ncbi:MAG TPA: gliding motility-associated C-terminal domain-containing protein [Cyclobacteriaceae bacterium]|nr:gliding motility-associated C-terminal domain-containing protein [Cyclobacteriaceae bacterium]
MKRIIIFSLLCLSVTLKAQQFKQLAKIKLNEKLEIGQAAWINLNSDTLLDVVITGRNQSGDVKIIALENEAGTNLFERISFVGEIADSRFVLMDYNKDNQIDLLTASGNKVKRFLNQGDFTFASSEVNLPTQVLNAITGDMNNDGVPELITIENVLDKPHVRIYEQVADQYELRADTTGISVTDFKLFDLNKDNFTDIVLTGINPDGHPVTQQWNNRGQFQFTKTSLTTPVSGKLSLLDFNLDGYFDLWAIGLDESGDSVHVKWLNEAGELKFALKTEGIAATKLFSGNYDADNLADQWILGSRGNQKINQIISATDTIQLDTAGVVLIEPGDFDRDGKLDFLQVIDSADGIWLKLYKNLHEVLNQRPLFPAATFGISIFKRTFVFWTPAMDDNTASSSLTYDVWLGDLSKSIFMPSYSFLNGRRSIVDHGNAGTNNSKIYNQESSGQIYYHVQTVDDTYNGSYTDIIYEPGNCPITGPVLACVDLNLETIQACSGNEIVLNLDKNAYWFSTTGKFLGEFSSYAFVADKSDTIFSFVPQSLDCEQHKVWLIDVNDGDVSETKTIYACNGSTIKLGIEPGWDSIRWSTDPIITDLDSISVVITQPQLIQVEASAGSCRLNSSFQIELSKPELSIGTTHFNIQQGESVQFDVTTNATVIQWIPATGLSDVTIPNPIANPVKTTQYVIEVADSIGCKTTGSILVEVRETGFIPDLFTPNSDGNNDVLLVYGLAHASSFRFRIFNREGSIVYQTDNVTDAIASGWNGSTNGSAQPPGMYFWRVEGVLPSGEPVLLNGNRNGSVFLMR